MSHLVRSSTLALVVVALGCAMPAHAQDRPPATSLAGGVRQLYQSIRLNVIEAADAMPEEHYAFAPTGDVRSFGQIVGHIANAQFNFCAAGSSEARPAVGNAESLGSKAELVAVLRASFEFCDRAYAAASDEGLHAVSRFGTADITRGYALVYNIAHDNEHYGNLVTYMRLKGLVPPSTARNRR